MGFDHPAGHEHCFLEFLSLGIRSSQPYKNLEGQACRAVGVGINCAPLIIRLDFTKILHICFPKGTLMSIKGSFKMHVTLRGGARSICVRNCCEKYIKWKCLDTIVAYGTKYVNNEHHNTTI